MTTRAAVTLAAVALVVTMSQSVLSAVDFPKPTIRFTPLVRLTRGDAQGVVTVPRHADNRVLRVILESEDYYSLSEVQLDGVDAPLSHSFHWQSLPSGSYRVTVHVYGTDGLRSSTSTGSTDLISRER